MVPEPDYGEQSYRGSGKLEGKAALITGADSGIGRAVALAFAREGADILISYLDEHQDAQETARVVREAGRTAIAVSGDVSDPAHCRQLVQRALQEFGRLDVLVNNAAFQQTHQSFAEISPEELERTYRTNIFAMFYLCQAAVPHMQPGSAIINTSSIQAYQPSPSLLAYASTKGAIVTFTKGLAQELAQKGIRVNVVTPGPVWTPLIPSTIPPERVKSFGQDSLLGRPAQPVELAPAFVFLAAPESSYVTGERLGVTGSASLP
jgi:NAD(P)-dependent dehydrogenase (short-subunit alcohol dehydrogenase family)